MNETQTETTNWLDKEIESLNISTDFGEKTPALKLESGKITEFTVDFTRPFNKWNNEQNGKLTIKAIIPVTHAGVKKVLWVNTKNPLYSQIVQGGKAGVSTFKVFTTGSQAATRYEIVKE